MFCKLINGKVSEVNAAESMVRLEVLDDTDVVTHELHVLQKSALDNLSYHLPAIGDNVWALLNETGDDGVVLGSYYTDENKPPASDANIFVKEFKDGTRLEYDIENKKLTADFTGDIAINIKGDVTAKIDGKLSADVKGDTVVKGTDIKVNADAVTIGGATAMKLVNEMHPCYFTGALHNQPNGNTSIFKSK